MITYELNDDHRDENFYLQAGLSMHNKYRLMSYVINSNDERIQYDKGLEEPRLNYYNKKKMIEENKSLQKSLKTIMEAYQDRTAKLKQYPEFLRAFERGFQGETDI